MLLKLLFVLLLTTWAFNKSSSEDIRLELGDAKCNIHIYEKQKLLANLIALHGNEITCIKSFLALHNQSPFVLYEIKQ